MKMLLISELSVYFDDVDSWGAEALVKIVGVDEPFAVGYSVEEYVCGCGCNKNVVEELLAFSSLDDPDGIVPELTQWEFAAISGCFTEIFETVNFLPEELRSVFESAMNVVFGEKCVVHEVIPQSPQDPDLNFLSPRLRKLYSMTQDEVRSVNVEIFECDPMYAAPPAVRAH
jgi:hypothetical protein